ncbi:hypothetical protein D3C83_238490 [compost metagenome]
MGLSYEEIGKEIGETPAYARTLLSRALVRLSARIAAVRPGGTALPRNESGIP